jgi:uncharacterized protein
MRKYRVKVAPRSSRIAVSQEEGVLKVHLTRPAQDGQANDQLIQVLAAHFKIKRYQVKIVQGETSRNKIVAVDA